MLGTVSPPSSQCEATADGYVYHDEYIVGSDNHQIYEAEASLNTKLITCPFYRCQKREHHAAGIQLVNGMCRNCTEKGQPVRDDAMDMQKLKAEIDS